MNIATSSDIASAGAASAYGVRVQANAQDQYEAVAGKLLQSIAESPTPRDFSSQGRGGLINIIA